jgi:replicative DNA helicase
MDLSNLNKDRKQRRKPSIDISTMVYGKVPPQAREIEQVILGGLLIDSNCVTTCMSRVFPEMFYVNAHQLIFTAIQKVYDKNQPIDVLIVVEQLKQDETLEMVGGPYAVVKLTNSVISGANIETHILILSEFYLKRQTIDICGKAMTDAYEDYTDAFEVISETDASLQNIQERVLGGMTRDMGYYGIKVLEQHASVKQTGVLGIKTGLTALDKTVSGLVAPDLVILAARPGQGKTACALSITYNTSVKNDIPCAWFSLEMDGVQLVRRLASIDTGIPHERIRNGTTSKEEDLKLGASIEKIANSKITIEDKTSINVRDIRTRSALLKKKKGIKYIVVDYIQLMAGTDTKGKSREQIVSEISRSLKCIAKELEIPVIALSQLSRAVESRPDKMPQLSDLRESGGIEQDADEVIFLMRPEYYHMTEAVEIGGTEYHPADLCIGNIAKNRHGSTKHVALKFTGPTMLFSDNYTESFTSNIIEPRSGWSPIKE